MESQPVTDTAAGAPPPLLEIVASRQLVSWLRDIGASIAFTTYQSGKLFFVGAGPTDGLAVFERTFNRCMGLYATPQTLYLSTLYQIWRMENSLEPGQPRGGGDRLYIPQMAWTTGDLDVHDIALDGNGRLVFVNTLFSCLATVSESHSFEPLWTPPFISRLAPEDRCHLNGLAMSDGKPRFVTAVGRSDVGDGWREHRRDGGIVIDVSDGRVIAEGLSMPHSPRVHQGKLWLLNSGQGEFGYLDPKLRRFVPLAFCPGYLRGLSFLDDFALVGLSRPRGDKTFSGLPLEEKLRARNAEARCGVLVIDLKNGDIVHWLRVEGIVAELYDVAALPGVRAPRALGFKTDEIRRTITIAPGRHA